MVAIGNSSKIGEQTIKLLARALDPGTPDAEAELSVKFALRQMRAAGVTVDDLCGGPAEPPMMMMVVNEPDEFDVIMPFGKHKGKTLRDIYQRAPGYLEWILHNTTPAQGLRAAIEKVLKG